MAPSSNPETTEPFPDFITIGSNTFLYEPALTTSSENVSDGSPSIIVLCTWMGGATVRRIQKYLTVYRSLFPASAILLVRTTMIDLSFQSFASRHAGLAPARDAIQRATATSIQRHHQFSSDHIEPSALLHIFSHGGCNTAIQLSMSIREAKIPFPLAGIIFDCCPGDMGLQRAFTAVSYSLPKNPIANILGRAVLYPGVAAMTALQHLRVLHSVKDLRRDLNDPALFVSDAKRLYLYSAMDETVRWQDVEAHMADARARGFEVDGARFERGAHCALLAEDGARYAELVKAFWSDSTARGSKDDAKPGSMENSRALTESSPQSLRSKL